MRRLVSEATPRTAGWLGDVWKHSPEVTSASDTPWRALRGFPPALFVTLGLLLFAAPGLLLAQRVTTVRETEFRSRWSNYQVDRPRAEVTPELRPKAADRQLGTSLRNFFQNGPIILRASVSTGWEYSDEQLRLTTENRKTSKSSLFTAPTFAVIYDRELGPWSVSARYSAGYVYYFNKDFPAAGESGGIDSQTAGFDIIRQGTRLRLRSSTTGSSGTGFEIDRGQETQRLAVAELLGADYQLSEYIRLGASLTADYSLYEGAGTKDSQTRFAGRLFGDYILTGKTGLNFEISSGHESQETGIGSSFERSYQQVLFGVNYQPSAKLNFRAGLGFGFLKESGARMSAVEGGLRTVYTLDVSYTPTEKLSALLHFGLEGTSVEPEVSLALNWRPRETTLINLSIYQQTGLSTISFAEDQTRRGILGSARQRLFGRLEANFSAGYEQQVIDEDDDASAAGSEDPYTFFSGGLGWEINRWLAWQVQYRRSTGRQGSLGANDRPETRATTSLRLTF